MKKAAIGISMEIIKAVATPLITGSVLLLIIYFAYKQLVSSGDGDKALEDDIDGNQLTYIESQYYSFADALEMALNGFWSTDEEAVYEIYRQIFTDSDLLMLHKAWGHRSFMNYRGVYYDATLPQVINGEMDRDEIDKINAILAANGVAIKY